MKFKKTNHWYLGRSTHANVLHGVESVALLILCHCRPITRKMALLLLKEVRLLFHVLGTTRDDDLPVLDVINKACPAVLEKCLPYLPPSGTNHEAEKVNGL